MADLIKKIKIKKQDGTFTDYIPIGAEAKDISAQDGESVQEKINKTIYVDDVINNLDSSAINKPLSAKQGNVLNKRVGSSCEFIFPGQWGTTYNGNSNIVKIKDKVLLFDTNSAGAYSYLINMFEENNITHIDYLVLTHFDSDHRGNIVSLINDDYLDENSYYIHPECLVEIYGQAVKNASDTIDNLCEQKGIANIIPEENEIIQVNDELSLRFGNVDSEYSLANYTNPNQATMVTEVNHNGFYALMMGDALVKTEKHLVDIGFIKNSIDLYTIPHHSIEAACYEWFYDLINPKFAVAQAQLSHFNKNVYTTNQSSALLAEKGCVNYYSYNNPTNIKFVEKGGKIECVNGVPTVHSGMSGRMRKIYCDSVNYNETKQDGTEQYPFKDLPQALGTIPDYNNQQITIHLNPGTYGTAFVSTQTSNKNTCFVMSRKNYIFIEGEDADTTILEEGLHIENCSNVRINNITIKTSTTDDEHNNAYILASNVLFISCKFIGRDTSNYVGTGIRTAYLSKVGCVYCHFNYLERAYKIQGASILRTNLDTINNLTNFIYVEDSSDVGIGTFSTNSDLSTIANFDNYSSSKTVLSTPRKYSIDINSTMTGTISLPISSQNLIYKNLVIHYSLMSNNSEIGKGNKMIPFTNVTSSILSENIAKNNSIDIFTIIYTLSNKTITISDNTNINIASDGTLTSHTPSSSSDTSYGIKITKIDLI